MYAMWIYVKNKYFLLLFKYVQNFAVYTLTFKTLFALGWILRNEVGTISNGISKFTEKN